MEALALAGVGVELLEGLARLWPATAYAGVGILHEIGPAVELVLADALALRPVKDLSGWALCRV